MYAIFAIGMRWPGIIFILLLMLSACSPDSRMADRTGSDFASFFSIIREISTLEQALDTKNAYDNLQKTAYQVFRLLRM